MCRYQLSLKSTTKLLTDILLYCFPNQQFSVNRQCWMEFWHSNFRWLRTVPIGWRWKKMEIPIFKSSLTPFFWLFPASEGRMVDYPVCPATLCLFELLTANVCSTFTGAHCITSRTQTSLLKNIRYIALADSGSRKRDRVGLGIRMCQTMVPKFLFSILG